MSKIPLRDFLLVFFDLVPKDDLLPSDDANLLSFIKDTFKKHEGTPPQIRLLRSNGKPSDYINYEDLTLYPTIIEIWQRFQSTTLLSFEDYVEQGRTEELEIAAAEQVWDSLYLDLIGYSVGRPTGALMPSRQSLRFEEQLPDFEHYSFVKPVKAYVDRMDRLINHAFLHKVFKLPPGHHPLGNYRNKTPFMFWAELTEHERMYCEVNRVCPPLTPREIEGREYRLKMNKREKLLTELLIRIDQGESLKEVATNLGLSYELAESHVKSQLEMRVGK